ncbi:MAG: hypothetical protein ACREM6_05990 [Vulcanimicrobiaceae bacterium]
MVRQMMLAAALAGTAALIAGCGGGGGGSTPSGGPSPIATPPPTTQQVVTLALPSTSIGSRMDATYGLIGGFTQQGRSQILGFAPGAQIMIFNGQSTLAHTFNAIAANGSTTFPATIGLSSANGGSTISDGFRSGSVAGGALLGPFTLAAGTYFVGCAFHYNSDNMRTVLVVAAGQAPGPQATAPPGAPPPPPPGTGGY